MLRRNPNLLHQIKDMDVVELDIFQLGLALVGVKLTQCFEDAVQVVDLFFSDKTLNMNKK